MPIFCYSPAVWVYVKSLTSGQIYDLSPDMVRGQTVLRENAPHQIQFTLMNKQRRYDKLFVPNDLFVCYMKRTRKLLVMSGYLDSAPWFSAWESSVQFFGTCTAKRLLQKRWDPGTSAALKLMSKVGTDPQSLAVDGGMRDKAIGLLTQVGGWPQDTIHIAALPTLWMQKVAALFSAASPLLFKTVWDNVGGSPLLKGSNPMVGSSAAPQSLPKNVSAANAAYFNLPGGGQAILAVPYSGTYDIAKPQTPYYCQMNWGYMIPGQGGLKNQMKAWLAGNPPPGAGPLMVYCPTTNKTVLCEIAGDGPGKYDPNSATVGLSPQALSTLGITTKMLTQDVIVYLAWCDQSESKDRYPPGPWPVILTTTAGSGLGANGSPTYKITTTNAGVQNNPLNIPAIADVQGNNVATWAQNQVGNSNYQSGATGQVMNALPFGAGHPTFDCSGLAWAAWTQAGLTWPRDSCAGWFGDGKKGSGDPRVVHITDPTKLSPGDLVFYYVPVSAGGESGGSPTNPNHMGIYWGTDDSGIQMTVQATGTTGGVQNIAMVPDPTTGIIIAGYGRPEGMPGFQATSSSSVAGSGAGLDTGITSTVAANTSFINYWDWFGQPPSGLSSIAVGVLGLLNDQPFLPFVNTVINSSMRSWCTAPNGDFISWFPDYFGAYGMTGSVTVEDVELQDFSIAFSDQTLVTHQYVTSSWVSSVFGSSPAGSGGLANIAMTDGIVTLEMGNISNIILQTILGLSKNDTSGFGDPEKLLDRFGARPNFQQIGVIMGPGAQFFYALFLFALNWASMFTTNIPITFMPEVFPGMLLKLANRAGLQVYVNQVVHSWDLTDGGPGFTTQVAVMAPSDYTKGGGLYGLDIPTGGSKAVI